MNALEVLANGFSRIPALFARATSGLGTELLASAPVSGANSIAWLAWHTARGQDSWTSDLDGSVEEWIAGGWHERFALPFDPSENGFGMSAADAARVMAPAALLTAYLDAVTARTLAYLDALDSLAPSALDDIVDATRTPAVSRGTQLMSILDDALQHAGQAGYARGILERSRPNGCMD
jgi:uncharacterized damage-inducible protein DinB